MQRAVRAAVLMGVRHAAHNLADYWLQPHAQAQEKGNAGAAGAQACAKHVATYTVVNAAAIALTNRLLGLGLSGRAVAAGEAVSAVTHYLADRREHGLMIPLARWMKKEKYLAAGGGPQLDQSWHHVWNAASAIVTAIVSESTEHA